MIGSEPIMDGGAFTFLSSPQRVSPKGCAEPRKASNRTDGLPIAQKDGDPPSLTRRSTVLHRDDATRPLVAAPQRRRRYCDGSDSSEPSPEERPTMGKM